ncbi:MAG: MarR family transcriptional regulator [Dehalococcoidia bacterium]|nr:MarR family transcriptional regulator [Dehalococcoidia bacterium]
MMKTTQGEETWESRLPLWTLVTSHGLALLYVAIHPNATIKEIAATLGLTKRRVADIIRDMTSADLVLVTRHGRRESIHS